MNLEPDIQEFRKNYTILANFYHEIIAISELSPERIAESLEELMVAVEELNVAQEELLQQNQELGLTRREVEEERQRYQHLFELAPDAYLVTDRCGMIQQANRAASEIFQLSQSFLVGKPLSLYVAPSERPLFRSKLNQLIASQKIPEWEICLKTRQGFLFDAAITVSSLDLENEPKSWLWLIRDISERKRVEAANQFLKLKLLEQKQSEVILRESEARFRSLFEHSPVAYQSLDEQGRFLDVNTQLCHLLGYESDELLGKSFRQFCAPETQQSFTEQFEKSKNNEITSLELQLLTKKGKYLTVLLESRSQSDENGRFSRLLCILHNITERKAMENALRQAQAELKRINRELTHLVNIDSLTEIANRRCFDWALKKEWQRLQREQKPLSMILFDVDFFKLYNDYYGHQKGDECLIKVAQAVHKAVYRPADLVARYGGEEFAIILPNIDQQGAIGVANRIQSLILSLEISHQLSPISDWVTVSFGIACLIPSFKQSPDILLQKADQALYQAKQQGRNRYIVAV